MDAVGALVALVMASIAAAALWTALAARRPAPIRARVSPTNRHRSVSRPYLGATGSEYRRCG